MPPREKTKAERVEERQQSAERILKWFKELKQLPKEPVKVSKHETIINLKKFLETQAATLEGNKKDPFRGVFTLAYMRLFKLKKFIEGEQLGTTNGEARKM